MSRGIGLSAISMDLFDSPEPKRQQDVITAEQHRLDYLKCNDPRLHYMEACNNHGETAPVTTGGTELRNTMNQEATLRRVTFESAEDLNHNKHNDLDLDNSSLKNDNQEDVDIHSDSGNAQKLQEKKDLTERKDQFSSVEDENKDAENHVHLSPDLMLNQNDSIGDANEKPLAGVETRFNRSTDSYTKENAFEKDNGTSLLPLDHPRSLKLAKTQQELLEQDSLDLMNCLDDFLEDLNMLRIKNAILMDRLIMAGASN